MLLEAIGAASMVAVASLAGAFIFGGHKGLVGVERFVIPISVGVFLSLVLFELIPETLAESPEWGGVAVAAGFIGFYILAQVLHKRFHDLEVENCDKKSSAVLLLIGDGFHNFADGIILGGAFLVDPALGFATAVGLAIHEVPQEIVEFGIFIRAGYTRMQAIIRNLLSASSIVVGTVFTIIVANNGGQWVWILTGIAAGNLLFLAASDLLPRIHGNLQNYGNIWKAAFAIVLGFVLMTGVLEWTHASFGHGHADEHTAEEHDDLHVEEYD